VAAHPEDGNGADEGGGEGGDCAEEAFGIAGVLVELAGVDGALEKGDDAAVKPGGEVAIGVEEGDVAGGDARSRDGNKSEESPVAGEEGGGEGAEDGDAGGDKAQAADYKRTEGGAGEDAIEAEIAEIRPGRMVRGKTVSAIWRAKRRAPRFTRRRARVLRGVSLKRPDWMERTEEAPTRKRKLGKTRSARVQPFQSAWRSGGKTWSGSPGLLTRIMRATVAPRRMSTEIKRAGATGFGGLASR
jgi:hypothetical protein